MKRHTLAVLSCVALTAAALSGCSKKPAAESPAASSAAVSAEETKPAQAGVLKMDMVVAGGSGAGLVSAVQAVKDGADPSKILVIEASGTLGSDLAAKEDFVNAADTDEQYKQKIEDSYEKFLNDMNAAGNGKNNQDLSEFLAESGQEVLDWLSDINIPMTGVVKKDGSSVARSYTPDGSQKLPDALEKALLKQMEDLKIQVMKDTSVKEITFGKDGQVTGLKVSGKDGDKMIDCTSLVVTDTRLLPLLKSQPVQFTAGEDSKDNGLLINNSAEVMNQDGESIPGLYAAGAVIEPALFGEKPLPGNDMTATILFGITSGTESGMYAKDNAPQ